jgi:hypothetical protein
MAGTLSHQPEIGISLRKGAQEHVFPSGGDFCQALFCNQTAEVILNRECNRMNADSLPGLETDTPPHFVALSGANRCEPVSTSAIRFKTRFGGSRPLAGNQGARPTTKG